MEKNLIEEQLIIQVQNRPALYNKAVREYKDEARKLELWNTIAEVIGNGHSGVSCKKLWESIRSQYVAFARKLKLPSGSARGKSPYFRHADAMKFLDDYVEPRKTASNFDDNNDQDESSQQSTAPTIIDPESPIQEIIFHDENGTQSEFYNGQSPTAPLPTTPHTQASVSYGKRKRVTQSSASPNLEAVLSTTLQSLNNSTDDEHDMFLKSLGPALKRLHTKSPITAAKFKMDVQRMLFEAEFDIPND